MCMGQGPAKPLGGGPQNMPAPPLQRQPLPMPPRVPGPVGGGTITPQFPGTRPGPARPLTPQVEQA